MPQTNILGFFLFAVLMCLANDVIVGYCVPREKWKDLKIFSPARLSCAVGSVCGVIAFFWSPDFFGFRGHHMEELGRWIVGISVSSTVLALVFLFFSKCPIYWGSFKEIAGWE